MAGPPFAQVSTSAVTAILAQGAQGRSALAAYLALAMRANRERQCWPSRTTIADDSGLSAASVKRALRLLARLGAISIEHRPSRPSVYTVPLAPTGGVMGDPTTRVTGDPPTSTRVMGDPTTRVTGDPMVGSSVTPELEEVELEEVELEELELHGSDGGPTYVKSDPLLPGPLPPDSSDPTPDTNPSQGSENSRDVGPGPAPSDDALSGDVAAMLGWLGVRVGALSDTDRAALTDWLLEPDALAAHGWECGTTPTIENPAGAFLSRLRTGVTATGGGRATWDRVIGRWEAAGAPEPWHQTGPDREAGAAARAQAAAEIGDRRLRAAFGERAGDP